MNGKYPVELLDCMELACMNGKNPVEPVRPLNSGVLPTKNTAVAGLFVLLSNYIALWNAEESSNVFTHTENTAGGFNFKLPCIFRLL